MTFLVKVISKIHENGGKEVKDILKNMKIKVSLVMIIKIHKILMIIFYNLSGKKFLKINVLQVIHSSLTLKSLKKKSWKKLI